MIIIEDNAFDSEYGERFLETLKKYFPETPEWKSKEGGNLNFVKFNAPSIFTPFVSIALEKVRTYVDISQAIGSEFWYNEMSGDRSQGNIHIDNDEVLRAETGYISSPLVSIIYYPIDSDSRCGDLYVPDADIHIKPKKNRLVLLGKDTKHVVQEGTGTRVSIMMNPFSYVPLTHLT
jgi:hypothetical protein